MANIKSAKKRARQSVKRRAHNMSRRSMLRTAIKRVLEAIEKGEGASASGVYSNACSVLDKAVKAGLIHKNKAARHKSHLSQKLKAIGAPSPVKSEVTKEAKKEPKKTAASVKKEVKPKAPKAEKKATGEKKPASKAKKSKE